MKISIGVPKFHAVMNEVEGDIARAATVAMRATTADALEDLRDQVRQAGLGSRLANTWRGKVYPKSRNSMNPAGYIHSNAPEIIESFLTGATILPIGGSRYLAIPTANVPRAIGRRGASRRMTPEQVEIAFNQDLTFRRGKDGHVLAFIDAVRSKNQRGWRQATPRRLAQGRSLKPVLMFVLVRAAHMPKLLELEGPAERWAAAWEQAFENRLSKYGASYE